MGLSWFFESEKKTGNGHSTKTHAGNGFRKRNLYENAVCSFNFMCSSAVEKNNTHPNKKNLKSRVVKKGPILANLHKTLTDVFQTNLAVKPNVFFTRVALYKKAKK